MATVSKTLADGVIAKNGYYSNDPRVMQVVTYSNMFGAQCWAVLYQQDVEMGRYRASPYVIDPKIVWEAK